MKTEFENDWNVENYELKQKEMKLWFSEGSVLFTLNF